MNLTYMRLFVVLSAFSLAASAGFVQASDPAQVPVRIGILSSTDAFVEKFQKRFGIKPDLGGDAGYDAMLVMGVAMKSAGDDASAIRKALLDTEILGSAGLFSFGPDRIAKRQLIMFTVKAGEIRKL